MREKVGVRGWQRTEGSERERRQRKAQDRGSERGRRRRKAKGRGLWDRRKGAEEGEARQRSGKWERKKGERQRTEESEIGRWGGWQMTERNEKSRRGKVDDSGEEGRG